jgi:hypothetical protein
MRQVGRAQHVAPAKLGAVEAKLARRLVHQPFHQIIAFGPAGATIGVDRDGVGEHADHVRVDGPESVHARQDAGAGIGRDVRCVGGQIGAHIGDIAGTQRQHLALAIDRKLAEGNVVTALGVADERLRPLGSPFHRMAELARRVAGQHVLGIEEQLHAEAAADIGGDDAKPVRFDPEYAVDQPLHEPAALGVGVERPAPGRGIVIGHSRACLHGRDDDSIVHHRQSGDMGRLGEQRVGGRLVTDSPVEDLVAGQVGPDLRCPGFQGHDGIGDRGTNIILDRD